jgi:hypothetical protein
MVLGFIVELLKEKLSSPIYYLRGASDLFDFVPTTEISQNCKALKNLYT